METVAFGGWENCIRLANGAVELIATTDVGPRIISLSMAGGANILKHFPNQMGRTGGDAWRLYGGHRLWHAPEDRTRTYQPDNESIAADWNGDRLRLTQPVEARTGLQKEIEVRLHPAEPAVQIIHRIRNTGLFDVELAAWALTVMAEGTVAWLPQEPYSSHEQSLLPARGLVLWPYTSMADPRVRWGRRLIRLEHHLAMPAFKLGVYNSLGWAVARHGETVFLKRSLPVAGAGYPDMNSNFELFTNESILEVETLGPIRRVPCAGGVVEHVEEWFLAPAIVEPEDEEEMAARLDALNARAAAITW